MAKYDPLRSYLLKQPGNRLQLTFNQIEGMIAPQSLPPSASNLRQWWENSRSHVQSIAWLAAGWEVDNVDLKQQKVTFKR